MGRSLVADLGLGPEIWLFLTLLATVTIFFKFNRMWSVRNLDLLLLYALAPALMQLVGYGGDEPWEPFVWLFAGSALWLVRCILDLGLSRRPLLEANLNGAGLTCAAAGLLGLLIAETIILPVEEGVARNPADSSVVQAKEAEKLPGADEPNAPVTKVLNEVPLPGQLRRNPPQVIFSRALASASHMALVLMMVAIGAIHYERPILGLSVAVAYLLSPYTRLAVVDSGQLVPAALLVGAVFAYKRPGVAGLLMGIAAGWMPPCLGLFPLWAGFYKGRGTKQFLKVGLAVAIACGLLGFSVPALAEWARALGARSLAQAGLLPGFSSSPPDGSFWTRIDPVYRLPVLIVYFALVGVASIWPDKKNLGELIALSAALMVASQFWYLDEGGTMILLYLPLVLLMMFRPNLTSKRPPEVFVRVNGQAREAVVGAL